MHLDLHFRYGPFPDDAAFAGLLASRGLDDPYSYAILDSAGRALGMFTLMDIRPPTG